MKQSIQIAFLATILAPTTITTANAGGIKCTHTLETGEQIVQIESFDEGIFSGLINQLFASDTIEKKQSQGYHCERY